MDIGVNFLKIKITDEKFNPKQVADSRNFVTISFID